MFGVRDKGEYRMRKNITKEQYERGMANGGFVAKEDRENIFSIAEMCGYGVYMPRVAEENGKYIVNYELGSTCD